MVHDIFRYLIKKKRTVTAQAINSYTSTDPSIIFGSGQNFDSIGSSENEWIMVFTREFSFCPVSYRIKTTSWASGHSHLKSWTVHASNNNITWDILDTKDDNNELNSKYASVSYSFTNIRKSYQFIKITCIKSYDNSCIHRLSLSEFDIDGTIKPVINCATLKRRTMTIPIHIIIILNK